MTIHKSHVGEALCGSKEGLLSSVTEYVECSACVDLVSEALPDRYADLMDRRELVMAAFTEEAGRMRSIGVIYLSRGPVVMKTGILRLPVEIEGEHKFDFVSVPGSTVVLSETAKGRTPLV